MATEPPPDLGLVQYESAYITLSTTRSLGFGVVGPIPVDRMWEWCDRHDVEPDEVDHFVSVIMSVDAETLRRQRKK